MEEPPSPIFNGVAIGLPQHPDDDGESYHQEESSLVVTSPLLTVPRTVTSPLLTVPWPVTSPLATSPVLCHECPKITFANSVELEVHVRVDHIRYQPYECTQCPYVRLPTEATIREHYKTKHPEIREPQITYTWNTVLEQRVKDHVAKSLSLNADRVCDPEVQLVSSAMNPMYAAHDPPETNAMTTKKTRLPSEQDETTANGGFCVLCQVAVDNRDEHCYDVHFDRAIFSCPTKGCNKLRCSTRAEMEQHIADVHGRPQPTRNGNYIKELTKLRRRCFPTAATKGEGAKTGKRRATMIGAVGKATRDDDDEKPKMVVSVKKAKATPKTKMHTCLLCDELVHICRVRMHIVKRHLQKFIKVCSVCSDVGTYGGAAEIERHIRKVHSGDEKAFVMNMTDIYASDIGQFYEQCFPNVKPILPRQTIG